MARASDKYFLVLGFFLISFLFLEGNGFGFQCRGSSHKFKLVIETGLGSLRVGQAQAFEGGEIKCLQKPSSRNEQLRVSLTSYQVNKLSTIHLFIHIGFKHLHSNPSPTNPRYIFRVVD